SERELQRKLHHSRIAGKRRNSTRSAVRYVVLWQPELRRVEHIEDFPPEFEVPSFTKVIERAANREVEVYVIGPSQRVPAAVAKPRFHRVVLSRIWRGRHCIGGCVKPAIDTLIERCRARRPGAEAIGKRADQPSAARSANGGVVRSCLQREWSPGSNVGDAADAPPTQYV